MVGSADVSNFLPTVCAGFGLLLVGGANLLLLRRGIVVRMLATLLGCGIGVGAAAALDQPGVVATTSLILATALVPCLLLSSGRLVTCLANIINSLQRPALRFGFLALAGIGTIIGGIVAFNYADEKALDESMAELDLMHGRMPTMPSEHDKATTDHGTPIILKEPPTLRDGNDLTAAEERVLHDIQHNLIRRGPASDQTNCHGWVFAGGRFILSPDDVALIIKENGYEETHEPHVGDIVIYRQNGTISHTALVRYVTEGRPAMVEGKWGTLGIFLHEADQAIYGKDYTFYHSHRNGHLLAGIGGPPVSGETHPTTATE